MARFENTLMIFMGYAIKKNAKKWNWTKQNNRRDNLPLIQKVVLEISQDPFVCPSWLVKKMIALVRPLEQFIRVFYSCWRCQTWFRLSVLFSKQHVCSLFLADLHLWSKFVAFLFISSRTEVMIELISKFNSSCEPTAQYIWFLLWICGHDFCCWSR